MGKSRKGGREQTLGRYWTIVGGKWGRKGGREVLIAVSMFRLIVTSDLPWLGVSGSVKREGLEPNFVCGCSTKGFGCS